jgi:hypothetical protein
VPEKPNNPSAPRVESPEKPALSERDQRRAEALRANLRRRKTQSRERRDSSLGAKSNE